MRGLIRPVSVVVGVLLACSLAAAQKQWRTEVVDNGSGGRNVGISASLAIDRFGDFHIGYFDKTRSVLRYAFRPKNGSTWFVTDVDRAGIFVSLAVDSTGKPHFAYVAPAEGGLRYAHMAGGKWLRQTIDPERINYQVSIQIDKQDHPRISYYHRLHRSDGSYALHPKYARFDGKIWYTQTVDQKGLTGKMNSLALDAEGRPYISYSDVEIGALRYSYFDGTRWQYGMPDGIPISNAHVGWGNCIAVDPGGNMAIAYFDINNRTLKYAYRKQGVWQREVVDTLAGRADLIDRVSLQFDHNGVPQIAYYDSGAGALKFAIREEKGWRTVLVDNDGDVGFNPSLALDADGNPYIAYYNATAGVLKLASLGNAPPPASETPPKAAKPQQKTRQAP